MLQWSARKRRYRRMRGSKEDLPVAEDYGEGFVSHQVEWGDMIVEISSFPAGVDAAPLFKGLPDDMCQSPHWGYVLKGRVRMRYKDREEVIEEDSELVEFSPKGEYEKTLEVVERNMAAMQEGQ
jgi:hypothetical protein